MKYDIYSLGIMTAVISFLGFVLENIWLMVTKKYIDNRNMSMPFLLGYGLVVVGMYILFGTPQGALVTGKIISKKIKILKYTLYFLLSMLIVSIGEILLGLFVEKFFGFEYWNYSLIPFHITKYTSVPTSIGFAFIILFFMDKCFIPIINVIIKIPPQLRELLGIILPLILITDFFKSFYKMYKNKSLNVKWKIYINENKLISENLNQRY